MMSCEEAQALMAERLAGEIDPRDREHLDGHLVECSACRNDFGLVGAGAKFDWPDEPVPARLLNLDVSRMVPRSVRFLRYATAAAAVLCFGLLLATSARQESLPVPLETVQAPRPARLAAMMPEASVGSMVVRDEEGRPVGDLGLVSHVVTVEINNGIAKTTVEENFQNHTGRRLEGTFLFPLPPDASISRLALEVNGKMEEGTCLERERTGE